MSNVDWEIVETIVDEVLDLPDKENWIEFLEERCSGSPEVKSEVTQLLESIFDSEGWLENPDSYRADLIDSSLGESLAKSRIGDKFGAYAATEIIAQGGMGAVYRGERTDGEFEHTVAIKVIKVGMDTRENIRLFNRERNILAGLNHSGIAKLFDGGVLENGAPYLIMEYVEGTPIDQYCDDHRLTVNERIDLFKDVLEAVRHAHENLIIHRDLKPDNILITEQGQVKILDFGISKLLDTEELPDDKLNITQARILTPKYAAPEQIRQEAVTTATDLYALGIILHQLLTGCHPYDLKGTSAYKAEQIILDTQPDLPSQQFYQSQHKEKTAEKRSSKVTSLYSNLKGDLDAVLLKAIEKKPENRYRTSGELSADLQKFKNEIPVSARKRTFIYRLNKFVRRNRIALAIAGSFILFLSIFSFVYTNQIEKERDQAEFQAQKATEIQEFLVNIFRYNNPNAERYAGKNLTARELLQTGLASVENELRYQPETQIGIMVSVGEALQNLDELKDAEDALQRAVEKSRDHYGIDNLRTANIYSSLAKVKRDAGEYEESDELIRQAIKINETSADTALKQLANKYSILAYNQAYKTDYHTAEELFDYADSLYTAAEALNSVERYNTLSNLAEVKIQLGKYNQALEYNEKALDFYVDLYEGDHINIATTTGKIGKVYHYSGDYTTADKYYRQALEMKLKLLDEKSISVAKTYEDIVVNLRVMGDLSQAEIFALKDLEIMREVYDEDHIKVTPALNNLGLIKTDLEQYEEAEKLLEKVVAIKEDYYEQELPTLAVSIYNLANLYHTTNRYEDAYEMYERVVEIDKKTLGSEHPEIAVDLNKLGDVARDMGAYTKADSIFSEAKTIFMDVYPENHYRVAEHLVSHGRLKLNREKYLQAGKSFELAADIFEENFGEDDSRVKEALMYLEKAKNGTAGR